MLSILLALPYDDIKKLRAQDLIAMLRDKNQPQAVIDAIFSSPESISSLLTSVMRKTV